MTRDLVEKLSHDFVAALNTEAVKERLTRLGGSPIGSSPQQFDAKIRADYRKWGPIIEAAAIKAERCTGYADDTGLSPAARGQPPESPAAAERLRYARACVRAGAAISLHWGSQLYAAGCA